MEHPHISIVIPFHWMDRWPYYLQRCLASIESQTYTNYEVILMKVDSMPITSNRVIESAKGQLIKVLYMDDYLAHAEALGEIVKAFYVNPELQWLVSGCMHNDGYEVKNYHEPVYTQDIHTGNNGIGSPSVLTMRRGGHLLFDDKLSWLLDVDLYKRLYEKYGLPIILNTPNVVIGLHDGQATHIMSPEQKQSEAEYLMKKHA